MRGFTQVHNTRRYLLRYLVKAILEHYGTQVGVRIARKHLGWYSKGLAGSAEYRAEINQLSDPDQVKARINTFYTINAERLAA